MYYRLRKMQKQHADKCRTLGVSTEEITRMNHVFANTGASARKEDEEDEDDEDEDLDNMNISSNGKYTC